MRKFGLWDKTLAAGHKTTVSLRAQRSILCPHPEIASSLTTPRNDSLVSSASVAVKSFVSRSFGLSIRWNILQETRSTLHASRLTFHVSRCFLLAASFLFLLVPSFPLTSVFAVTTQEVEEALTCQCGCGLTVHSCNHLQCGFAVPAKQTILDLVSQGKTKEEITASFTTQYGEKVLSAPTTSGFNLAAWITPFLAVVVGGVLIGVIGLRWSRRQSHADQSAPHEPQISTQQRERLRKELDSFEG